jgi:putative ABC transport system substrate-binding protein
MRRREFITLLGSAAAVWPLSVRAQRGEPKRRIGILMPYPPTEVDVVQRVLAFREELQRRGWTPGTNAQFDEQWTGDDMDLIRSAAANLVELNPEVILATGGRVIPILMEMTHTIPVIVAGGSEPVARGYVESLARPGGNVTGFANAELSVIGKMLQTLKEIAPQVSRVVLMFNPDNPGTSLVAHEFESAAGSLGVESTVARVHGLADIEQAVAEAAARPNGGIFVASDLTLSKFAEQTAAAVARHRLPAIYPERRFVAKGGLAYYGSDRIELYRNAAVYADRILRGEKPGDLPYQQPTKYDLVINLKTAKVLGLTLPPALLARADEVIE